MTQPTGHPCCICHREKPVLVYPLDDKFKIYCPRCCNLAPEDDTREAGHKFERVDGEWGCEYCGEYPDVDWLADYYSQDY